MAERESDDDIWDYKSLKRARKHDANPSPSQKRQKMAPRPNGVDTPTTRSQTQRKGTGLSSISQRSQVKSKKTRKETKTPSTGLRKRRTPVSKTGTKSAASAKRNGHSLTLQSVQTEPGTPDDRNNSVDGYCPNCQMPFKLLLIKSPNWHVTECMDVLTSKGVKECSDGLECNSTIPSHYRKFTHGKLAQYRAGQDVQSPVKRTAELSDEPEDVMAKQQEKTNKSNRKLFFHSESARDAFDEKDGEDESYARIACDEKDDEDASYASDEDIFSTLGNWPKSDTECIEPERTPKEQSLNWRTDFSYRKNVAGVCIDVPSSGNVEEKSVLTSDGASKMRSSSAGNCDIDHGGDDVGVVDIEDTESVCSEYEPELEENGGVIDLIGDRVWSSQRTTQSQSGKCQKNITSFFQPLGGGGTKKNSKTDSLGSGAAVNAFTKLSWNKGKKSTKKKKVPTATLR